MTCYKLNILKDSRDTWTESSLNPFVNINPIYINISDTQKDEFIPLIFEMISKCIIDLNDTFSSGCYLGSDLDFRIIHKKNMSECKVVVENDINSIVDFLTNNTISIYQKSTGKYWCRYYIEFSESSNKGCEYSIEEIKSYIENIF